MFPILFLEYSGKNILEFVHSSCSIGLAKKKKKKKYWTIFRTTPGVIAFWRKFDGRYCIPIKIAKIQTHFGGGRKLFSEEYTPGTDSTLNFI